MFIGEAAASRSCAFSKIDLKFRGVAKPESGMFLLVDPSSQVFRVKRSSGLAWLLQMSWPYLHGCCS